MRRQQTLPTSCRALHLRGREELSKGGVGKAWKERDSRIPTLKDPATVCTGNCPEPVGAVEGSSAADNGRAAPHLEPFILTVCVFLDNRGQLFCETDSTTDWLHLFAVLTP